MFQNYLKITLRNLWKNKVFSFINIIGLAIGLTGCMLIFLYTKDEISYDKFHEKGDRIYRITHYRTDEKGKNGQGGGETGMVVGPSFKSQIPEIEQIIRFQGETFTIKKGTEVVTQEMIMVEENFFSAFSFPLLQGDPKTALKDLNSVVLTEETALKYFGNTDVLGKVLEIQEKDKTTPFTVTGITKKSPQNSTIKFEMLGSFNRQVKNNNDDQWINFYINTFAVLHPKANPKAVEAKMKKVFETMAKTQIEDAKKQFDFKEKITFLLQPFAEMHLGQKQFNVGNGLVDASDPLSSYILSGIALFILLIACINFVNMTIAQSLKRGKEIGLRKAVGGERKQLILQFLGESFIISGIAFLLALILAQIFLPIFNTLANKVLSLSYLLDWKLILSYFSLFLLTGFVAGFYPALVLSKFNPVQTLYNRTQANSKNYLAKGLVVLQFSLATFLLMVTVAFYSQYNFLMTKNLGYDDKNMVQIDVWGWGWDGADKTKVKLFKEELKKDKNVEMVASRSKGQLITMAKVNGNEIEFNFEFADEKYFDIIKVPIVKGRAFSENFADSTNSCIVNETFAKNAGWKNPIGQVVDFWYNQEKLTVVGVVKDFHFNSLKEKIGNQLFTAKNKRKFDRVLVRVNPINIPETLKMIEAKYKETLPLLPYKYVFKSEINQKSYESEARWKQIITIGALLTIFISCIGLYGLASLSIEKRTKEIGIRKVLGASVNQVVMLISKDFMKLVILAFIFAIPTAYYAINKWLEDFPYRISIGYQIFVIACFSTVLVAFITISFRTIQAGFQNPTKSLKME